MTKLAKVCGIQDLESAKVAIDSGANFVGIILVPNRKRTINLDTAKAISQYLHSLPSPHAKLVGVFRNQPLNDVLTLQSEIGLDIVQLHGSEDLDYVKSLSGPVIRRLTPSSESLISDAEALKKMGNVTILIDSEEGGDGKVVQWDSLKSVNNSGINYILAGGLTPENVQLALRQPGCVGADVSSGVETDGRKDHVKIVEFVKNAHSL